MLYLNVAFYSMTKSFHLLFFQVQLPLWDKKKKKKKDSLNVILFALQLPCNKVAFIIIDFTLIMSTRLLEKSPPCLKES